MLIKICFVIFLIHGVFSDQIGEISKYRELVRLNNKNLVDKHNGNPRNTFRMKLYDRFASNTFEEIVELHLSKGMQVDKTLKVVPTPKSDGLLSRFRFGYELYVNWTEKGKVPPVTDQGYCGSCYAHAAVSDIETSYLFRGIPLNLSIQQIVDCSNHFGNLGCQGGWMGQVFDYVKINGITTQENYPNRQETFWQARQGSCSRKKGQFRIRSFSYTSYKIYDCESLTNMIQKRPVTVAVNANFPFVFYLQGIFNMCNPITEISVNHAMALTGVVENAWENYWIIKNSWSPDWGQQGYIRLDRYLDFGNQCQICLAPHYSIL